MSAFPSEKAALTQMLMAFSDGDRGALDDLMPVIYHELRAMAHRQLQRERNGHTLNTTGLVHEAFLKLASQNRVQWQNRNHFFAIAAQAMRRVLVNYARMRQCIKRGGAVPKVPLEGIEISAEMPTEDLLALDEALERLEHLHERRARIVECRYFGGFSIDETAEILGISPRTVKREWTLARAWLYREISGF